MGRSLTQSPLKVTALVGAVVLAALVAGAAATGRLIPGESADVQEAARDGSSSRPGLTATTSGIDITVEQVVDDGTGPVVVLHIAGADALGDTIRFGRTYIQDSLGLTSSILTQSAEPDEPRRLAVRFPAPDDYAGPWKLVIDALQLGTAEQFRAGRTSVVMGPWTFELVPPKTATLQRAIIVAPAEATIGTAGALIDDVLLAPTGTVIRGRLVGISQDARPGVNIEAVLVDASGKEVPIELGRAGYGPNLELFELRFPKIDDAQFRLRISLSRARLPEDVEAEMSDQSRALLDSLAPDDVGDAAADQQPAPAED
jgi:hypothetical protein